MNNNNIVKIGTALKWRNTFDINKKYYQENLVTIFGCVFRCKVLQAQGKPPVKMIDNNGHLAFANTEVWDVLVDALYSYNQAIDNQEISAEILADLKALESTVLKNKDDIEDLYADGHKQWEHINAIENVNNEQIKNLGMLLAVFSCFSEGVWINTWNWNNDSVWDNDECASQNIENKLQKLNEEHKKDIADLTDKHNSELSRLTANIVKKAKSQDDKISEMCEHFGCFAAGIWSNSFTWSNDVCWINSPASLAELENRVSTQDNNISEIKKALIDIDSKLNTAPSSDIIHLWRVDNIEIGENTQYNLMPVSISGTLKDALTYQNIKDNVIKSGDKIIFEQSCQIQIKGAVFDLQNANAEIRTINFMIWDGNINIICEIKISGATMEFNDSWLFDILLSMNLNNDGACQLNYFPGCITLKEGTYTPDLIINFDMMPQVGKLFMGNRCEFIITNATYIYPEKPIEYNGSTYNCMDLYIISGIAYEDDAITEYCFKFTDNACLIGEDGMIDTANKQSLSITETRYVETPDMNNDFSNDFLN